jgi:hypothetical protein
MRSNVLVCLFVLAVAGSLPGVTIGQIDTFQDGTTMGWFVPGRVPTRRRMNQMVDQRAPETLTSAFWRLEQAAQAGDFRF